MKDTYLDIMEQCFLLYGEEAFNQMANDNYENGVREHGFPRLAVNTAVLIANGRQLAFTHDVIRMMDFCCREMARPCKPGQGNDFSVQELVMAILALEKSELLPKSFTDGYRASLAKIKPEITYNCIAKDETSPVNNWAAYNALSEWMRVYAGICSRAEAIDFIDRQLATQLLAIDERFMYRDPHEPVLYDLVPRSLFALLLYFGYDGRHHDALREIVERSALITLQMQSVTGELPFGGRSNQFLHNEAFLASLMEFYAVYFMKAGDPHRAGMCKSSARLARESIEKWLDRTPGRHVKNCFTPADHPFGCERYASFDKYMITTASLCYRAYMVADDTIPEHPCPAMLGCGITKTSPHFHKLFMRRGDYQLEFDLRADIRYDGSGLGRVHKCGVPGPLCLSVPFPDTDAGYRIDNEQSACALCGFLPDVDIPNASYADGYRVLAEENNAQNITVVLETTLSDHPLTEIYTLADDGVTVTVMGEGAVGYHVPVFFFDGSDHTETLLLNEGHTLVVAYAEHTCRYVCEDAVFTDTGRLLANRNGHYAHYTLTAQKTLRLTITLS